MYRCSEESCTSKKLFLLLELSLFQALVGTTAKISLNEVMDFCLGILWLENILIRLIIFQAHFDAVFDGFEV